MTKSKGPRTDPCGTPVLKAMHSDVSSLFSAATFNASPPIQWHFKFYAWGSRDQGCRKQCLNPAAWGGDHHLYQSGHHQLWFWVLVAQSLLSDPFGTHFVGDPSGHSAGGASTAEIISRTLLNKWHSGNRMVTAECIYVNSFFLQSMKYQDNLKASGTYPSPYGSIYDTDNYGWRAGFHDPIL